MVSSLFKGTASSAPPTLPSLGSAPQDGAPPRTSENNPAAVPAIPHLPDITLNDLKKAVPPHLRNSVTQQMADNLNTISNDPLHAENIRSNYISYTRVLQEGKFKLDDYLNAVTYVSFKLMNYNNEEAYAKTFPQRYSTLVAKGTSKKDISAYVHAFHKGKLVNLIMEQCLTPSWVLNQDLYQKALNKQAELMMTATSEKVQQEAANSLLTHLGKPKDATFQVNIGQAENSGMKEMRELMTELATQQRSQIMEGRMKTIDVAASTLIPKNEKDEE